MDKQLNEKQTGITVEWAVESLVKKAAQSDSADAALKFSQAACNSANAMGALMHAKKAAGELSG